MNVFVTVALADYSEREAPPEVPRWSVFVCPSTGLVITRLRDEGVPNGSGCGVGFVPTIFALQRAFSQRSPLGVTNGTPTP
jgi:hypothetical protein